MTEKFPLNRIIGVLMQGPQAIAEIHGSSAYPSVSGRVIFYRLMGGVLVIASATGLPSENPCGFYGFHIHSGNSCSGTEQDPFVNSLTHYNPNGTAHPEHAGDMPPLLGNHGVAFQAFYTDRFSLYEIINKTVIIHSGPDDFTSQPAGNAGEKIACGVIRKLT